MAEAVVFTLIVGIGLSLLLYSFGLQSIDPVWVLGLIAIMLAPGFYAAFTSGPFVPSSRQRHRKMLGLANLSPDDIVYDLGCGDGRLVFQSAAIAKKAVGYELSVPLYLFGKLRQLFSRRPAEVRYGNIWNQNYDDATVIYCYLLPKAMKQFYAEVWPKLKPGTRVISNAFQIHELKPNKQDGKVYLYQV